MANTTKKRSPKKSKPLKPTKSKQSKPFKPSKQPPGLSDQNRNTKQVKLDNGYTQNSEQNREPEPELTDTIFLRNVSRFDTTQENLKAHMEENFGETVYCLICKDKETGESRGTAFVKFKEPETAAKCLEESKDRELQTKFFLDGRNLFVLPALTRNQVGEVKQASAKSDTNVTKKKKFKKARHHRVPTTKR